MRSTRRGQLTGQIFRITSDEPVGREGVDDAIDSATTFQERAERDGYGDGRMYGVDYFSAGSACSLQVMVPHSPKRLAVARASTASVPAAAAAPRSKGESDEV